MAIFSGIAKDAGATAVEKVATDVLPAAEKAAEGVTDHATLSATGLWAMVRNTLHGAALPINLDLTVSAISVGLHGQIGPLKLSVPESAPDPQTVEVKG